MTKEELIILSQEIENISNNFELKPWTGNIKSLKEDFDINKISTPTHYSKILDQITEVQRETRLLFLYSVLNKVCAEEGELYHFGTPFKASMNYNAVMKKEGSFYLVDEDGDYRDIFTTEGFVCFIDDQYWELYE